MSPSLMFKQMRGEVCSAHNRYQNRMICLTKYVNSVCTDISKGAMNLYDGFYLVLTRVFATAVSLSVSVALLLPPPFSNHIYLYLF